MHNWDIVLTAPYLGKKFGDMITVSEGMYNTLINLGKGVSTTYFDEELSKEANLIYQIKKLDKENKSLMEVYEKHVERIFKLEDRVEELEMMLEEKY